MCRIAHLEACPISLLHGVYIGAGGDHEIFSLGNGGRNGELAHLEHSQTILWGVQQFSQRSLDADWVSETISM